MAIDASKWRAPRGALARHPVFTPRAAQAVLAALASAGVALVACGSQSAAPGGDAGREGATGDSGHPRGPDAAGDASSEGQVEGAGPCSPGEGKCSGTKLQICTSEGTWQPPAACPAPGQTCQQGSCCPLPVVHTGRGKVQGQVQGGACSYVGIPYAAPPVGDMRWKPPQAAGSWKGIRPSFPGKSCPLSGGEIVCGGPEPSDEDCLFLNVWTPAKPVKSAPVMVLVHGGGFVQGCALDHGVSGANLAADTGVIVVSMDYRLGPLGFLSLAALRTEDPSFPTSGNYGILDQIAALKWVKENIAAFGGDPTRVTIFGGSAGGISVLVHLASAESRGLFQHAIATEAFAPWSFDKATADDAGTRVAQRLRCSASDLACLRGASVSKLLDVSDALGLGWSPVADGVVLKDDPMNLITGGTFNKVPIMLDANNDLASNPGDYSGLFCPTLAVARAAAAAGAPTFLSDLTLSLPGSAPFDGEESLLVFDTGYAWGYTFTPQEELLGKRMRDYWASFAASGDPNGGGRPAWPAFTLKTEEDLVLDETISVETALGPGVATKCGVPGPSADGGASDAAGD